LSPKEEAKFQAWAKAVNKNPDMESIDYDLRGFYKSDGKLDESTGHSSDRYKKPNHPTFSNQSLYHGAVDERNGKYIGGEWGNTDEGFTYTPSREMLNSTHNPDQLVNYIRKYEPKTNLILPNEEE
jgi:hypothetical protein